MVVFCLLNKNTSYLLALAANYTNKFVKDFLKIGKKKYQSQVHPLKKDVLLKIFMQDQ